MTYRGFLMGLFPLLHIIIILLACLSLIHHISINTILFFVSAIYLFPVICFHLHNFIYPLTEGTSDLGKHEYSPWWGIHQIQSVFNTVPALEGVLKIIPGAYSVWLRLWNSKIGRNVYWTAQVEVLDRNLMDVGDNVIFGHKAGCYGHIISTHTGNLSLYVKKIKIGNNVFIGAGSHIGPGAVISDDTMLPLLSQIKVNQCIEATKKCENGA